MASDWTDAENDAIVAEYFSMLNDELTNVKINKAERNRFLQLKLGRSGGSIEFKHQNISAVLVGLGETRISGYKPAFNFQASLLDAVIRWTKRHPNWTEASVQTRAAVVPRGLAEGNALFFEIPPTLSNAPPSNESEKAALIARKFDVAGRDARNRALGRAGEIRVLAHERANLFSAGRPDLAEQVRWVSDLDGDGAGYDIQSFDLNGNFRLIEVKTTNGWNRTPFHISQNELDVAESNTREWSLVRLYNFARQPQAFELRPPLEAHVSLIATDFRASFL